MLIEMLLIELFTVLKFKNLVGLRVLESGPIGSSLATRGRSPLVAARRAWKHIHVGWLRQSGSMAKTLHTFLSCFVIGRTFTRSSKHLPVLETSRNSDQ
jgi:hypothetical protein